MKQYTQIVFYAPSGVKKSATKRAEKLHMTLADVLNQALEAFVAEENTTKPVLKEKRSSSSKNARRV
jgi:hypothetical protein